MHPAAFLFVVEHIAGQDWKGKQVLEIGSADINSTQQGLSIRALCVGAKYHGIDREDGPGVDEPVEAAEFDGAGKFDLVVSTESLEHAERPEDIIECAARALKKGGLFVLTAAAPERTPHSTTGGVLPFGEHYQAIAPKHLKAWLGDGWTDVEVRHDKAQGDVYAVATRAGAPAKAEPKQADEAKADEKK